MTESEPITRLNAALEGRYRVERELGEGGMATVYLADDLKHERKVALKVLKPELAAVVGADRFLAEIKTTANLQHPHILPLFDSGEADGFLFYVMPYVEGETLREKLDRERQLPVAEALRITTDVAEALHVAHAQGVVHRDVKPANILLSKGRPLVADFGIALAVTAAGGGRLTETGLSLGTPYYMSPEQATADRDPGPQSDVYSLACMLYEMLVGDPPHTGSSAQAVLAKILTERPRPVTELRETVPPHVGAAVAKALERLPADRFESTEAFVKALGDTAFTHAVAEVTSVSGRPVGVAGLDGRRWTRMVPWGIAAVASGVALWSLEEPAPSAPVTRDFLSTPEGQEFSEAGQRGPNNLAVALRPDGSEVVYRGPLQFDGDGGQLWRRPLDALEATSIPGTEGAVNPVFSRDGSFLAFDVQSDLGVMSIDGGSPLWLEDAGGVNYVWGDDGAVYWIRGSRLWRWIPGSEEVPVTDSIGEPSLLMYLSDVLPGSEAFLISRQDEIVLLDVASGAIRVLGTGEHARYLETGHIAFVRQDGTLLVQPFDLRSRRVTGPAVATSDRVSVAGRAEYVVAADGTLVYQIADDAEGDGERLAWVERDGTVEEIEWAQPGPVAYEGGSVGPLGRRVAVGLRSPGQGIQTGDIWVLDLDAGSGIPLTRHGRSVRPDWHPSEERLAYVDRSSPHAVRWIAVDGSGRGGHVVDIAEGAPPEVRWVGEGGEMVIRMRGRSQRSLFRFVPGEDEVPRPWLDTEFLERNPKLAPGGDRILYVSDRSGRDEVYAQPYPDGGALTQISVQGGGEGIWSRDGREILYQDLDDGLWSARVSYDGVRVTVESRELLVSTSGWGGILDGGILDVSPDGRLLVRLVDQQEDEGRLVLVRNWVQEVTGSR